MLTGTASFAAVPALKVQDDNMKSSEQLLLELRKQINEAGLFIPDTLAGSLRIAIHVSLFVLIFYGVGYFTDSALMLTLLAMALGFVQGQLGIITHDLGHNQYYRSREVNYWSGLLIGGLLLGMSYAWWNTKHNRHHRFPNQLDIDTDISVRLHAYCEEQFLNRDRVSRVFIKYQAQLLFPLLFINLASMKLDSLLFWWRHPELRWRWIEFFLINLHHILYLGLLIHLLPPVVAIMFFLINQAFLGAYLSIIFLPNHTGMPILQADTSMPFLERQIITARNLRPGPITNYIFGPLVFQIEHHLFPTVALSKLQKTSDIVRKTCVEASIPYHETGVFQAFREILFFLYEVSNKYRRYLKENRASAESYGTKMR